MCRHPEAQGTAQRLVKRSSDYFPSGCGNTPHVESAGGQKNPKIPPRFTNLEMDSPKQLFTIIYFYCILLCIIIISFFLSEFFLINSFWSKGKILRYPP